MKSKSNYKLSHAMYGIWWATSIYGASKTIDCNPSLIYNNKKRNEFKGWVIEKTYEDLDDIPRKYVNATNEFVKRYHMETLMKMEIVNNNDDLTDYDDLKQNILKNSN